MSAYFHGRRVGFGARAVFGAVPALVFTALILTGCAKNEDDYGGLLDGRLICADREAWIRSGDVFGVIFRNDETCVRIEKISPDTNWVEDSTDLKLKRRWRTEGNRLIVFELEWGKNGNVPVWGYANEKPSQYSISGKNSDTLTVAGYISGTFVKTKGVTTIPGR